MISFEKWLESNQQYMPLIGRVVPVKELLEFLDGKAIVPRKPTQVQLEAMESVIREECRDYEWAAQQYTLAIEAGENE